jgi:dTDP-4-amino-4,6-dideoxygalactose transaminase
MNNPDDFERLTWSGGAATRTLPYKEAAPIPFGGPWLTEVESKAVMEVLATGQLTHGPQGQAFEEEFGAFLGPGACCVLVSSGMAALHLAYWQLGIGPGDEVIVAAQTHVATAHAVEYVGARPVFADCEPGTGNIDPDKIESSITARTKAIGLVHFLGIPCQMDAIMEIAARHGLRVIEDCALALGARRQAKHVGLFGDAGVFSFYPTKHITTGDGGMFVSRHPQLAAKVAKARAFGVDRSFAERKTPGIYDVTTLGLNYRMSDIAAAIGRKQLERIGTILQRRRDNFETLRDSLNGLESISVIQRTNPLDESGNYCLSVVLEGRLGSCRDKIAMAMNTAGIGTSVYYPHPVPRLSYYREKYGYEADRCAAAARISDRSIALPVGPLLDRQDVLRIGSTLASLIKKELR